MIGGFLPFKEEMPSPHAKGSPISLLQNILKGNMQLPKNLSPLLRDLLTDILVVDPTLRIGIDAIKKHRYFTGIDWTKVENKGYTPSYIPQVTNPLNLTEAEEVNISDAMKGFKHLDGTVMPNEDVSIYNAVTKAYGGGGSPSKT
jgi:protein kinase A/protein kinase X